MSQRSGPTGTGTESIRMFQPAIGVTATTGKFSEPSDAIRKELSVGPACWLVCPTIAAWNRKNPVSFQSPSTITMVICSRQTIPLSVSASN